MSSVSLVVRKHGSEIVAAQHRVAVSTKNHARLGPFIRINGKSVYGCVAEPTMGDSEVWLSTLMRSHLNAGIGTSVTVCPFDPLSIPIVPSITITHTGDAWPATHERYRHLLRGMEVLNPNERIPPMSGNLIWLTHANEPVRICMSTVITFEGTALPPIGSSVPTLGTRMPVPTPAPPLVLQPLQIDQIDVTTLDMGGLGAHIDTLFQRVLMSRCLPQTYLDRIGLSHVKGVVLHGPPGCGKTLMVRQLALKVLNLPADQVRVINGPEVMNKMVGETERAIRALFEPAEKNPNKTYVLVFDEFDALARKRGRANNVSSDLNDKIVNTLLTKMDGVESLPNIIVFALTNRLELLDDALLRPGRFEVHLYIGLPDRAGREEILRIHTRKMVAERMFDPSLIRDIAERTENYSGAELEGLVKQTLSGVLRRHVSMREITQSVETLNGQTIRVELPDFIQHIGKDRSELAFPATDSAMQHARQDIALDFSSTERVFAVFHGIKPKMGKTVTAGHIMKTCGLSYTAYVSARAFAGKSVPEKCSLLLKANNPDMPVGLIVLDDVDTLISFAPPGHFDNEIVQLIKTIATDRHHIILICKRIELLERLFMIDNATDVIPFDV